MDVFVCLYMIQIESNKDFKNKFYGKSKSWPEKKLLLKIVHLDQNQEIKSFIKNKSFLTLIK